MITLYDLLGVSKTASSQEIKTAFKKKALQYHPDKNDGNPDKEEIFKRINMAYQVLGQPQSRTNYDFSITPRTVSYPSTPQKKEPNSYKYQSRTRPFRPYVKTEIDWEANRKSTLYAIVASLEYGNTEEANFAIMTGITLEEDNLLGLKGSKAFSTVGAKTSTIFSALKAQSHINENLTLTGLATLATTNMSR